MACSQSPHLPWDWHTGNLNKCVTSSFHRRTAASSSCSPPFVSLVRSQRSAPTSHRSSIKIIPINLPTQYHHPQQKHTPHDPKTKRRLPIITDPQRLQPGQGSLALALRVAGALAVEVAVAAYGARGAVELDGGFDEAG